MRKINTLVVPIVTLALAGSLGTGLAFAYQAKVAPHQVAVPTSGVPAQDSKEVLEALDQTRRMVSALRDNGWRFGRSSQRLQNLPAQFRAEYPGDRDPARCAYAIPSPPGQYPYEEIATYTDVYVRKNIRHLGDSATAHPTGFYIVGWRDGRVETVPVDRVKMVAVDKDGSRALLFPGVTERTVEKQIP